MAECKRLRRNETQERRCTAKCGSDFFSFAEDSLHKATRLPRAPARWPQQQQQQQCSPCRLPFSPVKKQKYCQSRKKKKYLVSGRERRRRRRREAAPALCCMKNAQLPPPWNPILLLGWLRSPPFSHLCTTFHYVFRGCLCAPKDDWKFNKPLTSLFTVRRWILDQFLWRVPLPRRPRYSIILSAASLCPLASILLCLAVLIHKVAPFLPQ